jgi:hypothetical protein
MISYLLNSFLIGILFADLLERRFPEQFKIFLTEVTFNVIYVYSKVQIYFARANKNFNDYIEANPTLLKIKNDLDSIMKPNGGIVTMTQFFKNGKSLTIVETPEKNFDFAIYSWLSDDNKCINKKIIYDIKEPITIAEYSDIKFMLVEIKIGENKAYKIDLKTDEYNFYIVGNKFTKDFFVYYLINHLNIDETDLNEASFSIKIIDHNVENFQMDFTDRNESIVLRKNDYTAELNNNDN